jgi:hypothetical protein
MDNKLTFNDNLHYMMGSSQNGKTVTKNPLDFIQEYETIPFQIRKFTLTNFTKKVKKRLYCAIGLRGNSA